MAGSAGGRAKRGRSVAEQVADGSIVAAPEPVGEGAGAPADEAEAAAREAARARQPAGPQVYVVQKRVSSGAERRGVGGDAVIEGPRWEDIATVTVPARSKRRTIVEAARQKVAIELPATLRILDADAAREFPVGLKPRDPELVIG